MIFTTLSLLHAACIIIINKVMILNRHIQIVDYDLYTVFVNKIT